MRAATLVGAEIQRSGIGDDEPEASFDCFSAGVGGGGEVVSAGADSAAAGASVTGAAGGGCSCVQAARGSAMIAATTELASFAMSEPTLQAACHAMPSSRRDGRHWAARTEVAKQEAL
jgi:hypothetical protein